LSVIKGTVQAMRRKLSHEGASSEWTEIFERIDNHLNRLIEIQHEAHEIVQSQPDVHEEPLVDDINALLGRLEKGSKLPSELRDRWMDILHWTARFLSAGHDPWTPILISELVDDVLRKTQERMKHRRVSIDVTGGEHLRGMSVPRILEEIIDGLLKNAVENTPDEGKIRVLWDQYGHEIRIDVEDHGVGITPENQAHVFDGFFHTQDTDLYVSKRPYDFNAGGKGLDLLKMKTYSERLGLELSVQSKRCRFLPTDRDICPGSISECPHCEGIEDCLHSGGSTFSICIPQL
jgi:signal transduction histidine kinase